MNSMTPSMPKPPPTFESVWALCQENAAYIKETGELMRQHNEEQRRKDAEQREEQRRYEEEQRRKDAEQHAEQQRKDAEQRAEQQRYDEEQRLKDAERQRKDEEQQRKDAEERRKTEEQFRITEEQMRKTDEELKVMFARVDRVSKNIGGVNNSLGEIVEHMLASGIIKSFQELGFTFDKMTRETIVIAPDGEKRSVDMELHNGRDIMLIEIKAKPNDEDIADHVERIQFLRNLGKYTELNVYGAIAGAVFSESAKKYALKKGFFVIEQSGDTMRIETLGGKFKPKIW